MSRARDLSGVRFSRLTVQERGSPSTWVCLCDCGKTVEVRTAALNNGNTKSCGCLQRDRASESNTTHGHTKGRSNSRTFNSWRGMIERCYNPSHISFPYYGACGVTVAKEWRTFDAFLKYMGEAPTGRSIDRIDYTKNYEPGNCRWATKEEQARNKRNNRLVTFRDRTVPATVWDKEMGHPPGTVWRRIRAGWATEYAIYSPIKGYERDK